MLKRLKFLRTRILLILMGALLIYLLAPLYFCLRTYLKLEVKILKLALDETNSEVDLNFYIPTLRMFKGLNTAITVQMPMKNKVAEFKFANQSWKHLEIFNYLGQVKINYFKKNDAYISKTGDNKLHLVILVRLKYLLFNFNVQKKHELNLMDGKSKGDAFAVEKIKVRELSRPSNINEKANSQIDAEQKEIHITNETKENPPTQIDQNFKNSAHKNQLFEQLAIKEIKDVQTYEKQGGKPNSSYLLIAVKGTLHVPDFLNLRIDNFTCTFYTSEGKLCFLNLGIKNKAFEGTFIIDEGYFTTIHSAMIRFERTKKIGINFTYKNNNKYCSPLIKHIVESFCLILDGNRGGKDLFRFKEQIKIKVQQQEKNELNFQLAVHSSLFNSKILFQFLRKSKVEIHGQGVVNNNSKKSSYESLFDFNFSPMAQADCEENRITVNFRVKNCQFYSILAYFIEPRGSLLSLKVNNQNILARLISITNIYFDWRGGIYFSFLPPNKFQNPIRTSYEAFCSSTTMFLSGSVVENQNLNIAKLNLKSKNTGTNHIIVEYTDELQFFVGDSFVITLMPSKIAADVNMPVQKAIIISKSLECNLVIYNFRKTSSDLARTFKRIGLFEGEQNKESKFDYQGFEFKNMSDIRNIEFFLRLQGKKIKNGFLEIDLTIPKMYITLILATREFGLESLSYTSINELFRKKTEDEDYVCCDLEGNFYNPQLKSFLEQENRKVNLKCAAKVEVGLIIQRFKVIMAKKDFCIFPEPAEIMVTLRFINFSNFQIPFIGFIVLPEKNNLFSDFIYRNFGNSCIDIFEFIKKTKIEPRKHPKVTKFSKNNMTLTGKTKIDVLYKRNTNDIFITGAYTFKHESLGNFYKKYKKFLERTFFTEWVHNFETKLHLVQPKTSLQTEVIEVSFGKSWIKIYPIHITLLSDDVDKQSNFYFNLEFKVSARELENESNIHFIYGGRNKVSISIYLAELFKRFKLLGESDKCSLSLDDDRVSYKINEAGGLRAQGNYLVSKFDFQYSGSGLRYLEKLGYLIRRINLVAYPQFFNIFSTLEINFDTDNSLEIRINALLPIYYDELEKSNLEDQQKVVEGNFLLKKSKHPTLNLGVYLVNYISANPPAGMYFRLLYKVFVFFFKGSDITTFSRNTALLLVEYHVGYKFRRLIQALKDFIENVSPGITYTLIFDSETEKKNLSARIANYIRNMTVLRAIRLEKWSESVFKHFMINTYDFTLEVRINNVVVYKEKLRFEFKEK